MSDLQDRLALIARAGKRLRNEKGDAGAERGIRENPLPIIEKPGSSTQMRGALETSARAPMPNTGLSTNVNTQSLPVSGGNPVRLNFSLLRHEGMLTPDNMRSNLGFEYRAVKRKLLTNVRSAQQQGRANNLVMITSSRPAEGKTFTSANLAISLAVERELNVLLIDADVVRPRLSQMFEPVAPMGLLDLLKGDCGDITTITHKCTDLPNLNVIFSGSHDEHSPEFIGSRRMAEFCNDIAHRFSDGIIILDTPPVLASPETVHLAAFMHQIVMVVASGQTTGTQLQIALENVAVCPNISLLLNKAPEWNRVEGDTYYYYQSYYKPDNSEAENRHDSAMRR